MGFWLGTLDGSIVAAEVTADVDADALSSDVVVVDATEVVASTPMVVIAVADSTGCVNRGNNNQETRQPRHAEIAMELTLKEQDVLFGGAVDLILDRVDAIIQLLRRTLALGNAYPSSNIVGLWIDAEQRAA